jgi:hypothetical protein
MTSQQKSSIFREEALQRYIRSREKSILPRFTTPPILLFFWCLLIIFLIGGAFAWFEQVPVYATGDGVVPDTGSNAFIFIPYSPSLALHVGEPVQVQIGSTGTQLPGKVTSTDLHQFSPAQVRQRYQVQVAGPVVIIIVSLGPTFSAQTYAGSVLSAQVQVGSQRLISFLPGLNGLAAG